jgi:hypothetical protein
MSSPERATEPTQSVEIDDGMREWYDACPCCMSKANPEIKQALDAEKAAGGAPWNDPSSRDRAGQPQRPTAGRSRPGHRRATAGMVGGGFLRPAREASGTPGNERGRDRRHQPAVGGVDTRARRRGIAQAARGGRGVHARRRAMALAEPAASRSTNSRSYRPSCLATEHVRRARRQSSKRLGAVACRSKPFDRS